MKLWKPPFHKKQAIYSSKKKILQAYYYYVAEIENKENY